MATCRKSLWHRRDRVFRGGTGVAFRVGAEPSMPLTVTAGLAAAGRENGPQLTQPVTI